MRKDSIFSFNDTKTVICCHSVKKQKPIAEFRNRFNVNKTEIFFSPGLYTACQKDEF